MSFEFIDDKVGGRGDCLAEKVNAVFGGFAAPEVIQKLSEERTDIRGEYGQLICKAAGCSASCVVRVSEGEVASPDIDELGNVSNSCQELQEAFQDFKL